MTQLYQPTDFLGNGIPATLDTIKSMVRTFEQFDPALIDLKYSDWGFSVETERDSVLYVAEYEGADDDPDSPAGEWERESSTRYTRVIARAIVEEESDDDPAETLHFADDPQPTAATPANHGFTPYQLSQLTDCGLMAWDGNRYFKAYHFGVLDGGPVQFVITAGYDGMPADWRGEYDSLDDLLKSMTETAPADQWSDEDDDDDEDDFANITIEQRGDKVVITNNSSFGLYDNQDEYSYYFAFDSEDAAGVYNDPLDLDAGESVEFSVGDYVKATVWYSSAVGATICDEIDLDPVADDDDPAETPYGYFAACTYGGNSWELYKTPEQQIGVTGDYMRDLRAKVAGIELPENIEWVEVSPIEQGEVLIIVGSQFNSLYSPYNDEPMFLKYEQSIVTPEQFEATYPTLAAGSRAAGSWERNEMIRFDHSWRPNIN